MRFGFKVKARGRTTRRVAGQMNQTEARYELERLKVRQQPGDVLEWWFEGMTFKLGADLRYTPDFMVLLADGTIELHEVKAGNKEGRPLVEEDARAKIIAAAEKFPFVFRMCWWNKDYGWKERVY